MPGEQPGLSTRSRPPRRRGAIIAAVVVPVALVYAAAFTSLMLVVGPVAFGALAMTGGPSNADLQIAQAGAIVLFLPGLWGIIVLTRKIENRAFGEHTGRAYSRTAAVALMAAIPIGSASGFYNDVHANYEALFGAHPWDRLGAIETLTNPPTRVGCYVAKQMATGPADAEDYPAHLAAAWLGSCPGTKPLLIRLASSGGDHMRSSAGSALIAYVADDDAWETMRGLWLDDPEPRVRRDVGDTVVGRVDRLPAARQADVRRALQEHPDPEEWIRSVFARDLANGKVPDQYDRLWAAIDDANATAELRLYALSRVWYVRDTRSIPRLWKIERADYPAGFIAEDREREFRAAAAGELQKFLSPVRPDQYPPLYSNEQQVLMQLKKVIVAQAQYGAMFKSYATRLDCLETPATCVDATPGTTFLPALEASLVTRQGYARAFTSNRTHYAMTATPERQGETGSFAFCADDSQRVCFTRDGRTPPVIGGRCPSSTAAPVDTGREYVQAEARECLTGAAR